MNIRKKWEKEYDMKTQRCFWQVDNVTLSMIKIK